MALTQDKIRPSRGVGMQVQIPIATSSTVYLGSLAVTRNTTGRLLAGTAATGRRLAGVVVRKDSDASGNDGGSGVGVTSGTQKAMVEYGNEWLFTVKTAIRTNASLGLDVFIADDDSVGGTGVGTAATRIAAGRRVRFEAADKSTGWVAVGVFSKTNIAV